jgi:hypothetical protein
VFIIAPRGGRRRSCRRAPRGRDQDHTDRDDQPDRRWVLLALGVVEVVASIALFIGARWARVVAVLVAGFNGVAHLAFLATYPVGAILIMIASALVIWTVLNHGDAARV